jgi:GWxTD domain-containing protein
MSAAFEELQEYMRSGRPKDYRVALLHYNNLRGDYPKDQHVALALGLLYASGPDLNYPGDDGYRHTSVASGSLAHTYAHRYLTEVLSGDPTQWIAAVGLTRMALATVDLNRRQPTTEIVVSALAADPDNVTLALALADLRYLQRDPQAALSVLEGAAPRHDCSPVYHAIAESSFALGDVTSGIRYYLRGLSGVAGSLDRYSEDIRVLATPEQMAAFAQVKDGARAPWIINFWQRSAALAGRSIEARIVSHFARVRYADSLYRRVDARISSDKVDADSVHLEIWNAQGIVYVRHGPPDLADRFQLGFSTYETWIYSQYAPPVVMMFTSGLGPSAGVSYWAGCGDVGRQTKAGGSTGSIEMRRHYNGLSEFDPRYHDLEKLCTMRAAGGRTGAYETIQREMARDYGKLYSRMLWTESAGIRFSDPIGLSLATYQFRNAGGLPEVVAVARAADSNVRNLSRVHVSLAAVDSLVAFETSDTALSFDKSGQSANVEFAAIWEPRLITNGVLKLSVVDDDNPARGGSQLSPVRVRPVSPGLAISDIVIGIPDAPGVVRRGTHSISPLPDHRVDVGAAYRLFAELYALTGGESYQVSISIRRVEGRSLGELLRLYPRNRSERQVSFAGTASLDGRSVGYLDYTINGDLIPGEYDVVVRLTTRSGSAIRSTKLRVEPLRPDIR